MKKIILLWCLVAFIAQIQAQVITVTDKASGEPLELVTVVCHNKNIYTTTNAKGQASINGFENCQLVMFNLMGYKPLSTTIEQLKADNYAIKLETSRISIDEIVVPGTRWNQNRGNAPVKMIVIAPSQVALQTPQTAADLLTLSGKVFMQKSQQGGGSPMIRGFATNRLLYTVDGVRMNTAIFRAGNLQNVISLDPFAIEKTEVLFGPGSVIYGSDAIGGVMNFKTLNPQFSFTETPIIIGSAVTRYSTANNEKTGHFNINLGGKKWAMATSLTASNYGNLKMGSYGPNEYLRPFYVERIDNTDVTVTNSDPKIQRPSGYSQTNMMQKISFAPNQNWQFKYGFHYSETSQYSRYDRHIRYKKGAPRYGEWNYGPQIWMMNNFNIEHNANNFAYDQLTVRLAQQYFEESRISRDINKDNRETRLEKIDAYSANFDFVKTTGPRGQLFYGAEYVYNNVNSTGTDTDILTNTDTIGASRYPMANWASYAVYITKQFNVTNKFSLQGGLRYNHYVLNAKFDTSFYHFPFTTANVNNGALTGSFGFTYRPTQKWVISANAGTAFRSPNVDDMGKVFDSGDNIVIVPNPNLKAEYAYNAELGVTKLFGQWLKIDLTAYYTLLNNAMVRRNFTLNGNDSIVYDGVMSQVQALQNVASANVFGLQAGFEAKLGNGFGFSTDFNWQKGTEENDDGSKTPSRHAAPWFGNSKITYSANQLNLCLYAQYSGQKSYSNLAPEEQLKPEIYAVDNNGNPYSPAWYTLNFKAMYRVNKTWGVTAGIENITDQRYRPYSSGICAAGRNFILSLKANF